MNSLRAPTEQEVEKVLGEPIGFDISEAASKIRRNLLLSSLVVLALIFGDIEAGSNSSVFGVSLTNVTPLKLMTGLGLILFYNFLHYIWYCYELYGEWSLRVTGTKLTFVTGGKLGQTGADYPNDPKQSTLYNWWRQESKNMKGHDELLHLVDRKINELDAKTKDLDRVDLVSAGSISSAIADLKRSVDQVGARLVETQNIIRDNRIPASLKRFDNRFKLLLKSKNIRVLFVEVFFPLVLGVVALVFVWRYVFGFDFIH